MTLRSFTRILLALAAMQAATPPLTAQGQAEPGKDAEVVDAPASKADPAPAPPDPAQWQQQTLFSSGGLGDLDHGGYGGVVVRTSTVKGDAALFVGARGGWLIDHHVVLGLGGFGQALNIRDNLPGYRDTYLEFGYGGAYLGYHLLPERPVHVLFSTLIGGGAISHSQRRSEDSDDFKADAVFVLEPSVELEINLLSFMRLQVGLSYRWVQDVDLAGLDAKDLSGLTFGGSLVFGHF